jgi:thymidylate kinase
LGIKTPGIPIEIRNELDFLFHLAPRNKIIESINQKTPIISLDLLNSFLDVFKSGSRAGWKLYRMREKLHWELRRYRRQSQWRASSTFYRKSLRNEFFKGSKPLGKKKLTAGGRSIAIIGADGAGKSTVIGEVSNWLSWKVDVKKLYLGSQEPSSRTQICKIIARNGNRLLSLQIRLFGDKRIIYHWIKRLARFLDNLYHLSIAWDRYQRYQVGEKISMVGGVALFDRFPLRQIHEHMPVNPMDGPRIPVLNERGSGFNLDLGKIERKIYKMILFPDIIIALDVSPEISNIRKPDHDIETITTKSEAIRNFDRDGLRVTMIDADLPLESVLLSIKSSIWENL